MNNLNYAYDLSIIIPVFRVEQYIEECLRSVMSQRLPNDATAECILVDDLSPDKSIDVCRNLIAEYKGNIDFKIITHSENKGLSEARNSGIRAASGKYLYFIDSDDFIGQDSLIQLMNLASSFPNAQIIYGRSEGFPDPGINKNYYDLKLWDAQEFCSNRKTIQNSHFRFADSAWNKLILSDWLRSNSLYFTPGLINEDYDWHLRAYFHLNCYASNLNGRISYFYRRRANSIMSEQKGTERRINGLRILSNTAINAPYRDVCFFKFLVNNLISFRFDDTFEDSSLRTDLFRQLIKQILKSKNAKGKYRLILTYMLWPRSIMKVKILNQMLKTI